MSWRRTVLLTGGAGYIGSHTAVELLDSGWDVVVVDDFSNSSPVALDRVAELAPAGRLRWRRGDVGDTALLTELLATEGVEAVVHFAGLKAVGESVAEPLRYYTVNVAGTVALLRAMATVGVHRLVFSSSCTVYGDPERLPVDESAPRGATNPYGRTKLMVEEVLADVAAADDRWHVALLRYFNPVGAHPSGQMGEDPDGIPNNLMPYVMQVAAGRHPHVRVFGDDYPTRDGTGIRDYIHVMDLAAGHRAALDALQPGCRAINLGTGRGHTVLEVIAAASRAVGRDLPYTIVERRPGDVAATWADPSQAERTLGWRAERDLDAMAADHWRWQSRNPQGYGALSLTPDGSEALDGYSYRPARPDDAAEVAQLVDAAYRHYVGRLGMRPGPMTEDYATVIRDRQVIVAEVARAIVGVLVLSVGDDGFTVDNVAVHPAHRGLGLGRALLARAESEARRAGYDAVALYTHEGMTENQALYAKIGYVEFDRRSMGDFSLVFMRKPLG